MTNFLSSFLLGIVFGASPGIIISIVVYINTYRNIDRYDRFRPSRPMPLWLVFKNIWNSGIVGFRVECTSCGRRTRVHHWYPEARIHMCHCGGSNELGTIMGMVRKKK